MEGVRRSSAHSLAASWATCDCRHVWMEGWREGRREGGRDGGRGEPTNAAALPRQSFNYRRLEFNFHRDNRTKRVSLPSA